MFRIHRWKPANLSEVEQAEELALLVEVAREVVFNLIVVSEEVADNLEVLDALSLEVLDILNLEEDFKEDMANREVLAVHNRVARSAIKHHTLTLVLDPDQCKAKTPSETL